MREGVNNRRNQSEEKGKFSKSVLKPNREREIVFYFIYSFHLISLYFMSGRNSWIQFNLISLLLYILLE